MSSANTKRTKGLRATGVGAVSCARHQVYRPNGMGDLQIGERYGNMDYLFLSSIQGAMVPRITISYDIACQWSLNFQKRVNAPTTPAHLRPPSSTKITYLVPKFHLEAHTPKCHAPFSFNYTVGVGRTDGEGVERNWSLLNGIASSVSMMGPGSRWDTIDDFCNFANWQKMVDLPSTLLRKLLLAIPFAVIHHRAFLAFTESLRIEHTKQLEEWEHQVKKWEHNHAEYCPYDLPEKRVTFMDVKRQLSVEEHQKVVRGDSLPNPEGMSVADFVVTGLELECAQRELIHDLKASSKTSAQETELMRQRTSLLKRIQQFMAVRTNYLPGLHAHLGIQGVREISASTPELAPLYLPSSLPADTRPSICIPGLADIEDRLRFAQAMEALTTLRLQLAKRVCAARYKSRHTESQRNYTRFRALQDQTEKKIKSAQVDYTVARAALFRLRGAGAWEETLKVLHPQDIRGLGERALAAEEKELETRLRKLAGVRNAAGNVSPAEISRLLDEALPRTEFVPNLARGEGVRTVSWIWYSTTGEELEDGTTEAYLRVEWLRCRARAARWKEEMELLEEEMRRSIAFCKWNALWWEQQRERRTTLISSYVAEGISAYALEQADTERQRAKMWDVEWEPIRARAAEVLARLHLDDDKLESIDTLDIYIDVDIASDIEL